MQHREERQHKLLRVLGRTKQKSVAERETARSVAGPLGQPRAAQGSGGGAGGGGQKVVATIYPSNNVTLPDFIY